MVKMNESSFCKERKKNVFLFYFLKGVKSLNEENEVVIIRTSKRNIRFIDNVSLGVK